MINLAMCGVGYWGGNLLRTFYNLPDCHVALVCDQAEDALREVAARYPGVATTRDFADVLARADIDAVAVAIPPELHPAFAGQALDAGKHCFVEKPLTLKEADARSLIEIARRRKRVLMVGHTSECNPAVRWIKDYIDSGELGDVLHIFSQRQDLGRVRYNMNALWSLAPHDISMALYWLDGQMPVQVLARGHSFLQVNPEIEDMAFVDLQFGAGTVMHILVSWLSPEKIRKTTIVGSKRMIVYDDVSVDSKIRVLDKGVDMPDGWPSDGDYGEFQLQTRSGDVWIPSIPAQEPLKIECGHFIDCIERGETALSDGESGLRVVRVLEAAQRSLQHNGLTVHLESAVARTGTDNAD